jgi:hypothetical protein
MTTLFDIILATVFAGIYFAPTTIAFTSNKQDKVKIVAVNFLLGWTIIGWIYALISSLKKEI